MEFTINIRQIVWKNIVDDDDGFALFLPASWGFLDCA